MSKTYKANMGPGPAPKAAQGKAGKTTKMSPNLGNGRAGILKPSKPKRMPKIIGC